MKDENKKFVVRKKGTNEFATKGNSEYSVLEDAYVWNGQPICASTEEVVEVSLILKE